MLGELDNFTSGKNTFKDKTYKRKNKENLFVSYFILSLLKLSYLSIVVLLAYPRKKKNILLSWLNLYFPGWVSFNHEPVIAFVHHHWLVGHGGEQGLPIGRVGRDTALDGTAGR